MAGPLTDYQPGDENVGQLRRRLDKTFDEAKVTLMQGAFDATSGIRLTRNCNQHVTKIIR